MNLVYNFSVAEQDSSVVPWHNRAFQYGDGLFETIIYRNGKVYFLPDHVERLTQGVRALAMQLPEGLTVQYLERVIPELARQNGLKETARIRLQVWRKPGGLYTPAEQQTDFCITTLPVDVESYAIKENVRFFEDVRLSYSTLSAFKTCSALPYVLAGIHKQRTQADDVILLDVHGHVAECMASNLFWLKNNTLYTPSLASGCVGGVMRRQILHYAAQLHLPVKEGLFSREELLSADAVFCCNVAGIQSIRRIEKTEFTIHPLPEQLSGTAIFGI